MPDETRELGTGTAIPAPAPIVRAGFISSISPRSLKMIGSGKNDSLASQKY